MPPHRLLAACALLAGLLAAAAGARADDPFLRRTATVRVVEKVGPAVVNVTTERAVRRSPFRPFGDPFFDRFFQDFFEPGLPQTAQSLGSGVVIDSERHVLTNEHVIAGAETVRVTLSDGREFEASLVGADPNHDLAVLRIETGDAIPWVEPGSSKDLMVGEPLIAIGNPFGLSNTVTTGVLSAVNRSFRSDDRIFHGFLQTDAAINPGNSGGPLLTATGELVGINTAIYNGAEGVGFAIPVDAARRVVRELLTRGEVAPVWLGVDVQDLDPRLAEVMGLPQRLSGALVSRVRGDGPAAASGLARGDLITHVAGTPIRAAREFYEILERSTVGETLALSVLREGAARSLTVRTAEIPPAALDELAEQLLGLRLGAAEGGGLVVERVRAGSGAEQIGIAAGDRILAINGKPVPDAEALRRAALALRGLSRALVVVQRGRGRYHVTVPLS
jgi:Do/DeqQ family serine protease